MVYPYSCAKCEIEFEVVKHHSKSSVKEKCPECKRFGTRVWVSTVLMGTAVQNAEFNHGLGMVIKNKYQRAEECKRRDLIEVGNENPKKSREHFDRRREEKRKKAYET